MIEVVGDYRGDTYREVYKVRFEEVIYVLHIFQKKNKKGIATPKEDKINKLNKKQQATEFSVKEEAGSKEYD